MRKMRHTLEALLLAGALVACGGGDDQAVDETGTADTEVFTDSPDTTGVPTAAEGGTMADSTPLGTPGTAVQDSATVPQQP